MRGKRKLDGSGEAYSEKREKKRKENSSLRCKKKKRKNSFNPEEKDLY